MFYIYIIVSTICYLIGDYFAKFWIMNHKGSLLFIMLPLYFSASIFFLLALKKVDSLSLTVLFATLTGLIGSVCLGHFLFGERLNFLQYFGLGFAIIAITLLAFPVSFFSK
jgi:multidrug transporter EmrE-like cation transporter